MNGAIAWTVDDRAVAMQGDWQCTDTADGGCDQFRGTYPAEQSWVVQGSVVRGFRTDGTVLWEGRVYGPPTVRAGVAAIQAQGWKVLAQKYERPLLYRDDAIPRAVTADSDPHGYGSNDSLDLRQTDNALTITTQNTTDGTTAVPILHANAASGYVVWYENSPISRVSFNYAAPLGAMSKFDLLTRTTVGPAGGLATQNTIAGIPIGPNGRNMRLDGPDDLVALRVVANQDIVNTARAKVIIRDLSVWGRRSSDTITSSDVAHDLANILNYDSTDVAEEVNDITPLYWDTGSAADLFDYLCDLMDWRWGVREDRGKGPLLDFGPWSQSPLWRGSFSTGIIDSDLTEVERYNGVRVDYTTNSGEHRHSIFRAVPDPLADAGYDNTYAITLEDPQPNDVLARRTADNAMAWLTSRRLRGRCNVYEVQDEQGVYRSGYDIRAGDRLEIADYGPDVAAQRIASVTYSARQVDVELTEDLHLGRILWRLERGRRRGGRRGGRRG